VRREENVPAQQSAEEAHPRVPGADADASRAGGVVAAAAQGPQAHRGLTSDAAPGEALRREQRVRRRVDYLRAYRQGRRRSGALVVLHYFPNDDGIPRLGVTVSRKVGNSVVRHRVKRRVVEAFRRSGIREQLPAWDFVVHTRPEIAQASSAAVRQELERLLAGAIGGRR